MDKPSHPIGLQAFVKFKGSVLDMQDRNYFEVNPLIPNVIYIVSKRIRYYISDIIKSNVMKTTQEMINYIKSTYSDKAIIENMVNRINGGDGNFKTLINVKMSQKGF